MKSSKHITKLDIMISEGAIKSSYTETTDNTLKELVQFQDFLLKNSYNYECYKNMKPDPNQQVRLDETAATHNFETLRRYCMLSSMLPLKDNKEDVS